MTFGDSPEQVKETLPLSQLPGLSEIVVSRNLGYEIEKLKAAEAWKKSAGRSSETLIKYAGLTVVLVAMKAGTRMGKHHAKAHSSIHVMQGKMRLHFLEDRFVDMGVGDLTTMERGVQHDVEAIEECAFLLTLAGLHD